MDLPADADDLYLDGVPLYYDRDGSHISFRQWAELKSSMLYRQLRVTPLGTSKVMTVWLGIDQCFEDLPMIFGTATISEGDPDLDSEVFSPTEEAALLEHARQVALLSEEHPSTPA